ncbi:isoaspartyl peptidase/L-asparaginase family protein [Flavobacteriaceae bacterium M23B6Z8]
MNTKYAIAIHGGAGDITSLSNEQKRKYQSVLLKSLEKGKVILERKGSSIDSIVESIKVLEDSPLFNAGRGSVFNSNGINEMDAAIMEGLNLNIGSVTGVNHVKNPIVAAKVILDDPKLLMLTGKSAEDLVREQGVKIENTSYFHTKFRYNQFLMAQGTDESFLDHDIFFEEKLNIKDKKYGTVGAVAIDYLGNIAAGTSTGGLTNKKSGRIGDSAIPGAGTFASNDTCGISCTGQGEFFLRLIAGHEISAMIKYNKFNIAEALDNFINNQLNRFNAKGGIIAVDNKYNISCNFNTLAMFRGFAKYNGLPKIEIFKS